MPRRYSSNRYRNTNRRSYSSRGAFGFLKRPAVQLGILAIAAVIVLLIALNGNQQKAPSPAWDAASRPSVVQAMPR